MGIMVYSLFWVMQDLYHQPYGHLWLASRGLHENYSQLFRSGTQPTFEISRDLHI